MVNEEILGGLRLALEKGEPLKDAMMTFFNAGYPKEEIEEAARDLSGQIASENEKAQFKKLNEFNKEEIAPTAKPQPVQKVSDYGNKLKRDKLAILLVILILFLSVILGLALVFNQSLTDWINSLFS